MSAADHTAPLDLTSLARAALSWYDLPPVTYLKILAQGAGGAVEVGTGEGAHFVLRVHRPDYRSVANTTSELHFVQHLYDSGVHAPQPIPGRDGSLVVNATVGPITRHCDLLSWVDDMLVLGGGLDDAGVFQWGRALAQLHNASAQFIPPPDFNLPRWDADGMFVAEASPYRPLLGIEELLTPEDLQTFHEISDRTRAIFRSLDKHDDTFGIIHGDFILGNCVFTQRADVGVFDFADSGWGYYLYDLCPPLGNLAGLPGAIADNPDFPRLRQILFDGYRSARALPAEWEAMLPVLMASRNANHCLHTAGRDMSPTPVQDAAWRMQLARRCLALAP